MRKILFIVDLFVLSFIAGIVFRNQPFSSYSYEDDWVWTDYESPSAYDSAKAIVYEKKDLELFHYFVSVGVHQTRYFLEHELAWYIYLANMTKEPIARRWASYVLSEIDFRNDDTKDLALFYLKTAADGGDSLAIAQLKYINKTMVK